MILPRSDEEWRQHFIVELTDRCRRLLSSRGSKCVGGRALRIRNVEMIGVVDGGVDDGRLEVRWWDGRSLNGVFNNNYGPPAIDSELAGSIVLPILRQEMVLDDLADV